MRRKKLTKEEVLHLAKLSKLELTTEEIEKLIGQLEETLSFINNLNELETENIKPTYQTVNLKNIFFNDGENNQRQLDHGEVFMNTRRKKNNYFSVKKIF